MFYDDHRLSIVIGAYGSGKSEIAVNMSLAQRKSFPDRKLLIADLDIINPFYRSSDCAAVLENAGIKVISPMYAGSNVDAPVLPPEMFVIFDDESYTLFESTGRAPAANGAGTCLFDSADSTVTGWIFDENRRSYINMPIPKSALIRIVTLSTCASLSDERRVLQAILVREVKNTVERNEGQIK